MRKGSFNYTKIKHCLNNEHNLALIFIGMFGMENKLSRYTKIYFRISFAHEFF